MNFALQTEIDRIYNLLDEPSEANIDTAIGVLFRLSRNTGTDDFMLSLKTQWIQYKSDKLNGFALEGKLNEIVVRLNHIFKEYCKEVKPAGGSQDENYDLLCKLNFTHQTEYFSSLMKGDSKFISFVIRGPKVNYGQRWLANKLIHGVRNSGMELHETICLDFVMLNLTIDSLLEQLAAAVGLRFQQNLDMDSRQTKLKNELVFRIGSKAQVIVLINSYAFIHSSEYSQFLNMIRYFRKELNNCGKTNKCIFMFVEEQTAERYSHVNDCVFSDEVKITIARQIREFRFFDLGPTSSIKCEDVDTWLINCTDEQLACFQAEQDTEEQMLALIGDGNPQNVIPQICRKIGVNYIEKEKLWLKY